MSDERSFASALEAVRGVEGWMTDAQAQRLWSRAAGLDAPATVVEIGSYRGRSAIVLARAAPEGVAVVAIDPHAGNDRGPREIHGTAAEGDADNAAFRANLEAAGVADRVRHVRLPSQDALGAVDGEVDLLYVDGAHRYGPARADLARWGARVAPSGTLLVHDAFSSVGVTLALLRGCLLSRSLRYAGRDGSLAEYRRGPQALRGGAWLANVARQLAQLPWFTRNLVLKALVVVRLRPGPWPY